MIHVIDGSQGPFALEQPGAYGCNTSYNVGLEEKLALEELAQGDPTRLESLQNTAIRYTPEGQLRFNNVFGYVEAEIKRIARQAQDGMLDINDLAALFDGNEAVAQAYLSVLDRNHDGCIDVVEYAAFVMLSDDSANLIAGTMGAFADDSEGTTLYSSEQRDALRQSAQFVLEMYPTQLDGQITPTGRALADLAVIQFPTFIGMTLDSLICTLDLHERYAAFRKSSRQ